MFKSLVVSIMLSATYIVAIIVTVAYISGDIKAKCQESVPQEAPLGRSSTLPSGNFVVVDGDQVMVCYTSQQDSLVKSCEETSLVANEPPHGSN